MSETALEPAPTIPVPEIIQRYLDGELIKDLAVDARRSRQTLYNWMHNEVTDQQYPSLVRQALLNRMAEADENLESAASMLDLARAREVAKLVRWDVERRLKMFQPKQEVTKDSRITVIVQRERAQPVIIDTQPIDNTSGSTPNQGV